MHTTLGENMHTALGENAIQQLLCTFSSLETADALREKHNETCDANVAALL